MRCIGLVHSKPGNVYLCVSFYMCATTAALLSTILVCHTTPDNAISTARTLVILSAVAWLSTNPVDCGSW